VPGVLSSTPPPAPPPQPLGFDRLLSTGFTAAEIASLRSQFLALHTYAHSASSPPPTPTTLRRLEDAWLDSSAFESPQGAGGSESGAGGGDDENTVSGLDDLLWGSVVGFFWPIGCLWWAVREEGIWSRRRKMAVVVGCLVNVFFGGLRWLK